MMKNEIFKLLRLALVLSITQPLFSSEPKRSFESKYIIMPCKIALHLAEIGLGVVLGASLVYSVNQESFEKIKKDKDLRINNGVKLLGFPYFFMHGLYGINQELALSEKFKKIRVRYGQKNHMAKKANQ